MPSSVNKVLVYHSLGEVSSFTHARASSIPNNYICLIFNHFIRSSGHKINPKYVPFTIQSSVITWSTPSTIHSLDPLIDIHLLTSSVDNIHVYHITNRTRVGKSKLAHNCLPFIVVCSLPCTSFKKSCQTPTTEIHGS